MMAKSEKAIVKKKKGFVWEMKKNWELYLLVLPALLYLLLFVYKPMGGILMAFEKFRISKGIWGSEWVWFDNFKRFFSSYWFPITLKNTLTLSVLSLILGLPTPIILALAFNELKEGGKIKKWVQTISYAPHFIATVVMCGMLTIFLNPEYGVINRLLGVVGVEPISFLSEPRLFKWIYVLSAIWQQSGWSAIIYISALSGVDKSLLEAAEIDGASRFQKVVHVNFPVLVPTIIILTILNCGSLLSVGYEKVLLLQQDLTLSTSEVLSTYTYKLGLVNYDYSFSTAASLFNSVVNAIILVTVNKLSAKFSETSLW